MSVFALRTIEDSLRALAERADDTPVDGCEILIIASQVRAQREMIEQGLAE